VTVYKDSVPLVAGGADYTFLTGGGQAGADRIKLTNLPYMGELLTSDFTGYLRMKARLKDDNFPELMIAPSVFSSQLTVTEVQW
jgi:hypothetical protein